MSSGKKWSSKHSFFFLHYGCQEVEKMWNNNLTSLGVIVSENMFADVSKRWHNLWSLIQHHCVIGICINTQRLFLAQSTDAAICLIRSDPPQNIPLHTWTSTMLLFRPPNIIRQLCSMLTVLYSKEEAWLYHHFLKVRSVPQIWTFAEALSSLTSAW